MLGGNAVRCHGQVTTACYASPDVDDTDEHNRELQHEVPVVIPKTDEQQQLVALSGLVSLSGLSNVFLWCEMLMYFLHGVLSVCLCTT